MLADLTAEELAGWRKAYEQEPWGEARADQRAAANTLWTLAPHMDGADLPGLHYPYFETTQDVQDSIDVCESYKRKVLSGNPPSPPA